MRLTGDRQAGTDSVTVNVSDQGGSSAVASGSATVTSGVTSTARSLSEK